MWTFSLANIGNGAHSTLTSNLQDLYPKYAVGTSRRCCVVNLGTGMNLIVDLSLFPSNSFPLQADEKNTPSYDVKSLNLVTH